MPKAQWILSSSGGKGTKPSGPVAVYSKAEFDRRKREAKRRGVEVSVREAND